MIKRRTLLSALPLGLFPAVLTACARAQPVEAGLSKGADMAGMAGEALTALTDGAGGLAWLKLAGTVRLSVANANVRPATLYRAVMAAGDGTSARIFDVWQIADLPPIAAPSITRGSGSASVALNDAGIESLWVDRAFTHTALQNPIELSRLARERARVIAIDATQIWLLEGNVAPAPTLSSASAAAFDAWRAS
jgi:hypothetical protein